MKLKDTFLIHEIDDQQMLVDITGKFAGLVRSNETAAFIVNCLTQDTTPDAIVSAMADTYDAPKDVLTRDVAAVLEKLRSIHALDE